MTNQQADSPQSSTPSTPVGVSVVMPAFNEEQGVAQTIIPLLAVLEGLDREYELIVVDDGSEDRTAECAAEAGARVLRSRINRGYGASLKLGIADARFDTIVIIDADGTYPASAIPRLLEHAHDCDMVVGARIGDDVNIPSERQFAKWVLRRLASYLAGQEIPDLNSGLRVIQRPLVDRFSHLLPSGFSFTTTITLASLCTDCIVHYEPIDYAKRVGKSKIRPTHAFDFLLLILRTVVFFNPLKVFLPLGAIFFFGGFAKFVYDLTIGNFSETALLGFLGAAIIWAVGLLSDQIARIGLGLKQS
jgi:glycosyltransferase involved in cell wall biosynthesis